MNGRVPLLPNHLTMHPVHIFRVLPTVGVRTFGQAARKGGFFSLTGDRICRRSVSVRIDIFRSSSRSRTSGTAFAQGSRKTVDRS